MRPNIKFLYKNILNITILSFIGFNLAACSTNPATGKQEFTPLLPASQEKQVGAEQHRSVVNEFGGLYKNDKLTHYIQRVSNKIAAASELPVDYYHVFLLNSPEVNAFALPGGYVYLTRGLVALANTEAELAGVIGHEMGHITARHAASRSNIQAVSGIGAMLAGVLTGSQQIAQLAQLGGQGLSASYSRGQEHEADMLGVRYLAKSGYNPYGQADFLRSLRLYTDFKKEQSKSGQGSMPSFFATHPDTASRVTKARTLAQEKKIANGLVGRQSHLNAIKGMIWGSDPSQGLVQGNKFIHPDLKFAFSVPNNYNIINQPDAIYVQGAQNTLIKFDADFRASGQSPAHYLTYEFAKGSKLSALQTVNNQSFTGVTALTTLNTNQGAQPARLFAFKLSDTKYYRFTMSAPQNIFSQKERDFYQIAQSLRNISSTEANAVKPHIIDVKTINRNDNLNIIASRVPNFSNKTRFIQVLNGLDVRETLPKSGYVKIIKN